MYALSKWMAASLTVFCTDFFQSVDFFPIEIQVTIPKERKANCYSVALPIPWTNSKPSLESLQNLAMEVFFLTAGYA